MELRRIKLELSADAFKKMILALNTISSRLLVSITLTPEAFPVFSSYKMECTTENGLIVRFPVLWAHGRVADTELKYPPNGQPRIHKLRAWHFPRPCSKCISCGSVKCAHLAFTKCLSG